MKNIFKIFKKEIKSYLNNPASYIVMVIFLVLWKFLFFRSAFLINQASLVDLFNLLPWLFLFLIPALTMGSIASEKSDGTIEVLLSRPIKEFDLVVGKYLAGLFFVLINLAFSLPIAISFSRFGALDWGVFWGQVLASFLLASMFVSLGVLISSFFVSQIAALLVSACIGFILVISGSPMFTAQLPLSVTPFFEQLSSLTHFNSMSRGVIDLRDVWYFISLSITFLILSQVYLLAKKFGNQKKAYRNYQLVAVLFVLISLISNVVSYNLPGRIDLTQSKIYTLSSATEQTLKNLEDVVTIKLYVSEQLPAQFQPLRREVLDILKDYRRFGGENLILERKDPSIDNAIKTEAITDGVNEVRFNVVSNDEFQIKRGFFGISLAYEDQTEVIPFVNSIEDLEYKLTGFIKKITNKNKSKIYFVSGHAEGSIFGEFNGLRNELSKQFETQILQDKTAVSVPESEEEPIIKPEDEFKIPEDASALVFLAPIREIPTGTFAEVKRYIELGGSVLFLVDRLSVSGNTLAVNEVQENLADFLSENYFVNVEKKLVYDLKSNQTISFSQGGAGYFSPYPFFAIASAPEESQSPVVFQLKRATFPWAHPISFREKIEDNDWQRQVLMKTSSQAGTQAGNFNISPDAPFSNRNLSEKNLAIKLTKETDNGLARLIVVGNSAFAKDSFTASHPENLGLMIEMITWLSQEESLNEIRLKDSIDRELKFENEKDSAQIKYPSFALAILAPVLFGVYRIGSRKKMKKNSYKFKK